MLSLPTSVAPSTSKTADYSYDASGNMTGDLNRSILVGYNHLNKPTFVEKGVNEGITYIYAADGTKLRQKVHDFSSAPMGRPSNSQSQVLDPSTVTKITDYVGPYQYEDADGNATQVDKQLIQFQHAKGRATWDGSEFHYQYNLTDHLGNVRVVFQDGDKDGRVNPDPIAGQDVVQVIQGYYPFGMSHSGSFATTTSPENQYLYNGKEKQDELNLGWYDYGARMYDATIGRWNGVDALAEEYQAFSPYNYTLNNPILYIDPDGNSVLPPDVYINEKGNYLGKDNEAFVITNHKVRVISAEKWNELNTDDHKTLKENSTLLTEYTEEGGINITEDTWKTIQKNGGEVLEATVVNNSEGEVTAKPEDNINDDVTTEGAITIGPGNQTYIAVDGIKTPNMTGEQVFRIATGERVVIDNKGEPRIPEVNEVSRWLSRRRQDLGRGTTDYGLTTRGANTEWRGLVNSRPQPAETKD